jgi:hypothetical protein
MVDSISQAPIATLQQLRRESDSLTQGYYAHAHSAHRASTLSTNVAQ